MYSKTCAKRPLSKRPQTGFQDQLFLNACQKYYRMLQGEHSAILSTFIKLPFVILVLSILSGRFTQVLYGDKPVKNDTGEMSMSEEAKQNAWAEHYERLLNVKFDWDPDHLSNEPPLEGPPIPITIDMVKKAISKMKPGKAAGPSGIVVEMIKAAGDTGATMIRDLATAIIRDGKVPTDWEESFIVCLYKGKGDALDRGNYRGLKLTEQAMKILERIVDGLIRQVVSIDDSQFGFVQGRGTTDAIFVVRQLQEKYLAVNKRLYMAFVDLEKAFDRVPRKVIWWALRKLGVEEWIVRLVQGM